MVGAVAGTAMVLRLFVPNPIGLADSGDGIRLMCHLGVVPLGGTHPFDYAVLDYVSVPGVAQAPTCFGYPSSTRVLMAFAQWVSQFLHLHASLDLRVVMVLYAVMTALVTAALCRLVGGGWKSQATAAAGLFIIVGDSVFADYPGSAFTETAAIIGVLVMAIAAVYVARTGGYSRRLASLAVFTAAASLAVSAKVPTVTIVIPVAAFLGWLAVRAVPGERRMAQLGIRVAAMAAVVVITIPAVTTYHGNPTSFSSINSVDTLFVGVLTVSDSRAADLRDMGIPSEFAKYAGRSWWDTGGPQSDPQFPSIRNKINNVTIGEFLLTHPWRAVAMADVAAKGFLVARPTYLGTYQVGDGPARGQECRVCLISTVMANSQGLGLIAFGLFEILLSSVAVHLLRRRPAGSTAHSFAAAALLLSATCLVQFLTAAYGEAIEMAKHQSITIFSGLLCALCVVLAALVPFRDQPPLARGPRRKVLRR
ncbi:MAG: glycan biosynthesis hexose transferase WsfD [Mycobacteriaceae bacterium]